MADLGAVTRLRFPNEKQRPSGVITGQDYGSYASQLKLLYPVQIISGTGQRISINVYRKQTDGSYAYVELQPQ